MRTLTMLSAIFALAFSAYTQDDFVLKHRGNLNIDEMQFRTAHLSEQQCDRVNYKVGRAIAWDGGGAPYRKLDGISGATVSNPVQGEKTPAWVTQIREKSDAYRAERLNREQRYEEKLSKYSATEIRIARFLGKEPWEIDRKQLKRWGEETDGAE